MVCFMAYRLGRRPDGSKKRIMSVEQKQKVVERFKKAKEAKKAKSETEVAS